MVTFDCQFVRAYSVDSLAAALVTECTDECVCLVGLGHVSLVLTA